MQPPLAFADAFTQLKLFTSQTGNFTFSDDEITQQLQLSWDDTYVVTYVYDATLNYAAGTFTYPIPTAVDVVSGIYFQRTTTDNPEPLDRSLYEVFDGNIIFNENAQRWLGDNYQLFVRGRHKVLLSESLSTPELVNYTINLATEKLLSMLLLKKTFVFLTNDTSIAEIAAALKLIQSNVLVYKQAITREFEGV